MKKITFLFLLFATLIFAQNHTTGVINLTTGMTAKFDTSSTIVTLTLTGPSDRWFALGIGVSAGFGMSYGDCLVYSSSLSDRSFIGMTNPAVDASQNWTVTSNTIAGTTRTIVATRALNTGDANDYIFTNNTAAIGLAWALPPNATTILSSHGSRGFATANLALSTDEFTLAGFKLYPNPVSYMVALELPQNIESVDVAIFDLTGKKVFENKVTSLENKIDVSIFETGNYILKVSSECKVYETKFVKN